MSCTVIVASVVILAASVSGSHNPVPIRRDLPTTAFFQKQAAVYQEPQSSGRRLQDEPVTVDGVVYSPAYFTTTHYLGGDCNALQASTYRVDYASACYNYSQYESRQLKFSVESGKRQELQPL